jgi:hypothetical protein
MIELPYKAKESEKFGMRSTFRETRHLVVLIASFYCTERGPRFHKTRLDETTRTISMRRAQK